MCSLISLSTAANRSTLEAQRFAMQSHKPPLATGDMRMTRHTQFTQEPRYQITARLQLGLFRAEIARCMEYSK